MNIALFFPNRPDDQTFLGSRPEQLLIRKHPTFFNPLIIRTTVLLLVFFILSLHGLRKFSSIDFHRERLGNGLLWQSSHSCPTGA